MSLSAPTSTHISRLAEDFAYLKYKNLFHKYLQRIKDANVLDKKQEKGVCLQDITSNGCKLSTARVTRHTAQLRFQFQ